MKAWCESNGQVEVGVIEHDGRIFASLGSSVQGNSVTAYTHQNNGKISLCSWSGLTKLACRFEIVEKFRDGSLALIFRLTKNRFIVGYALGSNGMLFRGELVMDSDQEDAKRTALTLAHHFAEKDTEDELCLEDVD